MRMRIRDLSVLDKSVLKRTVIAYINNSEEMINET